MKNPQPLTLAKLDAMPLTVVEENKFELVNRLHHQAGLCMAQSTAFMILAGFELLALRKLAKHGTWEKNFPERGKVKSGNVSTFAFSYDTARYYMAAAERAKKHIKALHGIPIAEMTLGQLSTEQRAIVLKAVHKTCDGQTFQQLAWDWGFAKKPRAAGALGGDTTTDEEEEEEDVNSPEAAAHDLITCPMRSVYMEFFQKTDAGNQQYADLPRAEMEEIDGYLLEMREALAAALHPAKKSSPAKKSK
jgi:hypothetical protein